MIARTPTGLGVLFGASFFPPSPNRVVTIEVDYMGRKLKADQVQTYGAPWRDYFGNNIDHLKCVVRVKDGEKTLAELALPDDEMCLPFMVLQGDQIHITENYVSIPPALHLTDEVGAVWTLGFVAATLDQSPQGEFAFEVLRDGIGTREIASRIERRNNRIRIFTKNGWKRWLGSSF